jgi:hypothetical protein
LDEHIIKDYIPAIKRSEDPKKLRYKKSHAMPMIPTGKYLDHQSFGVASNDEKI